MRYAYYKNQKVKVLGTEENKYHIEFENGSSILADESELDFFD